ncbi:Peptidase M24, methionine aminopeptidase [Ostreococcus tauri]|uniref:Methionine aminopeptidase n=2 Tax=Ostreococcus tauri TaxID=70448 RepID=A0A090LXF3_OSTTA|nr:Peptidase M24, methionine aminopeptidase [Ostreococcus tauri]CEF96486.1 Peptidase M24, methionine aminopeptidase [Ostreococcus tauri]|eukprot:XP_003074096.2 Peptidase M24, methionine aminopeptidase [Ostreococcus tauri]
MNFTWTLEPGAPRYFHHARSSVGEAELEITSVVLLAAAAGSARVRLRVRYEHGESMVVATLTPGETESTCVYARIASGDARFSVEGGVVEVSGRVLASFAAASSDDDDDDEAASSDDEGLRVGEGSDESWGSDVEATRETVIEATAGVSEGAASREAAARAVATTSGRWRTLDEIRNTLEWWDAAKGGDERAFHVQNPGARRSSRSREMPKFAWTGKLRPRETTAKRSYPSGLQPPDYAVSGWPDEEFGSRYQSVIEVKPHSARDGMRAACSLARHVMDTVAWAIEPGVTTDELDRICHAVTVGNGAYPSPLNYMGFPKSLCTSVNEVVCHGIPDARPLEEGDIINLDVTVRLNGYHGDLNETYYVGKGGARSKSAQALMDCTRGALEKAIAYCRPGRRFRDLGEIIAREADRGGYASVKDFCGHGIGELFHCAPNVPHYARNKAIGVMKEGMTFTIEPMFNESSSHKVVHWPDGWTAVTTNGARSAQYEHTLLITSDGVEVLTARTKNSRPFII